MKIKTTLAIILSFFTLANFAHATPTPNTLKVLTLNTWLLSVLGHPIGKDQEMRAEKIPQTIADLGADLIAMQEVWPNHYKESLTEEFARLGYPYSFFNKRKIGMGNGLMIISKYPIISAELAPIFKSHTRLDEQLAGKRALHVEVLISDTLTIDFYTLHAGALSYDEKLGNYNRLQKARQRAQYIEFKNWMQSTRKHAISIIAGDFNADYRTLSGGHFLPDYSDDYLELTDRACSEQEDLSNSFLIANHMDQFSTAIPTYSVENAYVAGGLFASAPSETEDYVYSCGISKDRMIESKVIFKDNLLSDHYGLTTSFNLNNL